MYRLLCDTMDYAYIYYSFERILSLRLEKWDDFFDFQILDRRDFVKLQEMVDEPYVLALREMLFLEKSGQETDFCGMHAEGKEDLAAVFQQDFLRRWQADGSDYCGTEYHQTEKRRTKSFSMAYYDSLTGLYNRNYFVRLLTEFPRRQKKITGWSACLLLILTISVRSMTDWESWRDELVQQFGSFSEGI